MYTAVLIAAAAASMRVILATDRHDITTGRASGPNGIHRRNDETTERKIAHAYARART